MFFLDKQNTFRQNPLAFFSEWYMPIIKSAKKRMKQNTAAYIRNHAQTSRMRSLIKNIITWVKEGELKKAQDALAETQKSIDICAKKNLIHKNNAARKKSRIAKLLNNTSTTEK